MLQRQTATNTGERNIRVLLIDDSKGFRERLTRRFAMNCPEVLIEEYDPRERPKPGPDFNWERYQLILLDYDLGLRHEKGLHWLRAFMSYERMPPVIVLTQKECIRTAVKAIKLGAEDYVLKNSLGYNNPLTLITKSSLLEDLEENQAPAAGDEATSVLPMDRATEASTAVPEESTSSGRHAAIAQDLRVPGYDILKPLADGGMSAVLLAERREDRRRVVLKIVSSQFNSDPQWLKRFMQEYSLISELDHVNVIRIYERAFAKDYAYIAMEYVSGGDLNAHLHEELDLGCALAYFRQMTQGLAAIHELDVVHRDLKPGNVLFREDGTLCIADFGVAKDLSERAQDITIHNMLIGTPYYMSPEQAIGGKVDSRSDLYSLGVMLFQMLTGARPYQAKSIADLIRAHVREPIPRLPAKVSKFQPIIDGLLAKDPDERFQTAHELLAGLDWVE